MSAAIKMARADYQGDPGLFGAIWGGIKGVATGGLSGGITGAVRGFRGEPKSYRVVGATTPPQRPPMILPRSMPQRPVTNGAPYGKGSFTVDPTAFAFGGRPFISPADRGVGTMNGKAPGGYHWNKTSYFTQSEGWVEAGTKVVKNRRRNPGNIKAASRSLSRVIATKKALSTFSKVSIRDPNAVTTRTVYRCLKCKKNPCSC